jgi:hypothetical protein
MRRLIETIFAMITALNFSTSSFIPMAHRTFLASLPNLALKLLKLVPYKDLYLSIFSRNSCKGVLQVKAMPLIALRWPAYRHGPTHHDPAALEE